MNWLILILSAVAAGCWLMSALVSLPTFTAGGNRARQNAANAHKLEGVIKAARAQSKWGAGGAAAAGLAALLQAIQLSM